MNHIIKREEFTHQYMISEVFRSEVTWGGSLLGRLFNSAYRKGEIEVKNAQMASVCDEIVRVFNQILVQSLDRDTRIDYYRLKLKWHINRIKEECYYKENKRPDWDVNTDCQGIGGVETKLKNLIGINTRDAKPDLGNQVSNFDSVLQNPLEDQIDALTGVITWIGEFTENPIEPEPNSYLSELFEMIDLFENNKSYTDLLPKDERDGLKDIHSMFLVELRRYRIFRCLSIPYVKTILTDNAPSNLYDKQMDVSNILKNLRDQLSENVRFTKITPKDRITEVPNNSNIFKSFSEFSKNKILLEGDISNKNKNNVKASGNSKVEVNTAQEQNVASIVGGNVNNSGTMTIIVQGGSGTKISTSREKEAQSQAQNIVEKEKESEIVLFINKTIKEIDSLYIKIKSSEQKAKQSSEKACKDAKDKVDVKDVAYAIGFVKKLSEESIEKIDKIKIKIITLREIHNKLDTKDKKTTLKKEIEVLDLKLEESLRISSKIEAFYLSSLRCLEEHYEITIKIVNPVPIPVPPDPITTTTTTTSTTTTPTPPDDTTGPADTTDIGDCDIKCIWDHFFKKGDTRVKAYLLTRNDQKQLDEMEKKIGSGSLDLNYNPDPVSGKNDLFIYLVKLLRRAFDLFATQGIRSGRPNQIVSPSVYREYIKMGRGKDDQSRNASKDAGGNYIKPDQDSYYANKKIHNQFANRMTDDILGDQKFRKIFSNINFQFQGTEDTFSALRKDESFSPSKKSYMLSFKEFSINENTSRNTNSPDSTYPKKYKGKNSSPGRSKEIGTGLLTLLNTLVNDIGSVESFDRFISQIVSRYFLGDIGQGMEDAAGGPPKSKPEGGGGQKNPEGEEEKECKWEAYQQEDARPPKGSYLAWSVKIEDNNSGIADFSDGILNTGNNHIIFINRNPKDSDIDVEQWIPVKITIDDPIAANYKCGSTVKPNLQRDPNGKIYYAYIRWSRRNSSWHMFYRDNDKVHYNSFKIDEYTYSIGSDNTPVKTLKLSKKYFDGAPISSSDYGNYKRGYSEPVGSTPGKTFVDFMKDKKTEIDGLV